jgi:hypothetical protein
MYWLFNLTPMIESRNPSHVNFGPDGSSNFDSPTDPLTLHPISFSFIAYHVFSSFVFCWFSVGVGTLRIPHMHDQGRVVGRCALVLSHPRTCFVLFSNTKATIQLKIM